MSNHARQNVLQTPAEQLKGVGPQRAARLAKLGLRTALDILFAFPRSYDDLTSLTQISDLEEGPIFRLTGTVEEIDLRNMSAGRSMLGVLIKQGNEYLRAVWFNQPFLARQFQQGQQIVLTGSARLRGFRWEMAHPKIETLKEGESPACGLQPVYRLTEGISQYHMRSLITETVQSYADEVQEVFPEWLLEQYELLPIADALRGIHQPSSPEDLEHARYRFAYQELLTMQLALALRKSKLLPTECPSLPCDGKIAARIERLLPFALTEGQQTAVHEITGDMADTRPMNRMLQGDVGSGKTVVAAYAMLVAIAHQHQAVIMAPTEILARQHFRTMQHMLAKSRVNIGFLSGSLKAAQRRSILEEIKDGTINLIIGTQAIVQKNVEFHRLGLAVVDEGHRFGVRQRARLKQGDFEPHYLVMTATPIPRTVAMTVFGDLEVSILRQLPAGRQPIHTYVGSEQKRAQWWDFIRRKLDEGRQAYIVAPLVDEQEGADVSSVEQLFEHLCSEELDAYRVGLVHGRMSTDEQLDAMDRFRRGQTQALVATSLVEVGVDVPNASVMTIENAERFGLAQLHQLRGRVGRGKHAGFVTVFSPSESPEARQRLDAFASTSDGFELAELDFQLRGPGELFGTRQHGMPRLRVADLQHDFEILQQARLDAKNLLQQYPELKQGDLAELRKRVLARYGSFLELGDVG